MSTLTLLAASMTSALFAAIWQSLLLAVVVALCLKLVPKLTAAARSVVWLTVAALAVLLHFTQAPTTSSSTHAFAAQTLHPAFRVDARWSLLIAAIWCVASLIRAVQLATGALELRRLARAATAIPAPDAVCASLLAQSRRWESRPIQLCTSTAVDRPSVLGFFRPRILLPATLLETLAPAELYQVLLHELEHLRRRDDWTNFLGRLALVLFPLNPVLLWLERRLATERELACDDRVLEATGARKAYATCLAHLAEHTLVRRGISLALAVIGFQSAWFGRSELARRVTRILSLPTRSLNPRVSSALVTVLIVLASGGSVELAHSPQLIRFTSAASQADLNVSASSSTRTQFQPVLYHQRTGVSPFLETKAILAPRSVTFHFAPASLRSTPRRAPKTELRPSIHRSPSPSTSFVRLTSFHLQPYDAQVRLTLSVANANQFSYAAVPVNGGWILVLLPAQAAQPTLTLSL